VEPPEIAAEGYVQERCHSCCQTNSVHLKVQVQHYNASCQF